MSRPLAMIWTEGILDRVAAERLVEWLGMHVEGAVRDAGGIIEFWESIGKYNEAAKYCGLVFALADHDESTCVGPKLRRKLRHRHANLVLRLSVRELEAWLLADTDNLAAHLSVSPGKFPRRPDLENNPKRTLVDLAARSTKPAVRAGMVPKPGLSTDRGPEYTLIMASFIRTQWHPAEAAKKSPSLARAIAALRGASEIG